MIFRLFQTNKLFGYILSYVVTVIFLSFSFSNFELTEGTFLYHLLGNNLAVQIVLFLFVVLLLPFSMISFFEKHQIHKKSVYFQYFLFLLLTFPVFLKENIQDLILLPILISILNLIMTTYNQNKVNVQIGTLGILFGLLVLIKTEVLWLLPVVIIGLAVFRSFLIKDIVQFILAATIVPLIVSAFDVNDHLGISTRFFNDLQGLVRFTLDHVSERSALIPSLAFSLIAFFNLISRVNYLAIRQQLYRYIFIWLAMFSVLLLFVENAGNLGIYFYALAAIVPLNYYFKTIKSRFWSDIQIILIAGTAIFLM